MKTKIVFLLITISLLLSPKLVFSQIQHIELIRQDVGAEAEIVMIPESRCANSYLVRTKKGEVWYFTVNYLSKPPHSYKVRKVKIFHSPGGLAGG